MNIKAQPGFVVVEWVEEEKIEGESKSAGGIILTEDTANRLKKEKTHQEWVIISVSKDSELEVGTKAITSKRTIPIPIELDDMKVGVMAEAEIVASY